MIIINHSIITKFKQSLDSYYPYVYKYANILNDTLEAIISIPLEIME